MGYILKDELDQFWENAKKEMKQLYEKIKQHPLTCLTCIIVIIIALLSLIVLPYWRVTQFGITNPKDFADAENSYRATIAQILGGIAVAIGIYFAWGNLTTAREGQITERFTRAVDQLGNPSIEIRLGGIYALERIASESEKDYWPIMEILTAYIRKNSLVEVSESQEIVSFDIQAILTVIKRRKNCFNKGEYIPLNLQNTCLQNADIHRANLEGASLNGANLEGANLEGASLNGANLQGTDLERANLNRAYIKKSNLFGAYLKGAYLNWVHLNDANLYEANLEDANLYETNLEGTILSDAYLEGAKFIDAHLEGANLQRARLQRVSLINAHLEGANFEEANLGNALHLTVDQLSKVKTLYNAKLDEKLEKPLREKYPDLFKEPMDKS